MLPRIESIHLPALFTPVRAAEPFGSLEGDKGIVDLYAPCDGTIVAVNVVDPRALRDDPLSQWLAIIAGSPGPLLSATEYEARTAFGIPR